jgi:hypothetical protein
VKSSTMVSAFRRRPSSSRSITKSIDQTRWDEKVTRAALVRVRRARGVCFGTFRPCFF